MGTYKVETIICGYHVYQVVGKLQLDKCCLASGTFTILTLLLSSTKVLSMVMCSMPYHYFVTYFLGKAVQFHAKLLVQGTTLVISPRVA